MIETKSAFARRIGVHKSQITRAAQAGRLVLMPDGRINVEASVARWYATKGGRSDVAARHAANRGAGNPPTPAGTENAPTGLDFATSQPTQPDAQHDGGVRIGYKAEALDYENRLLRLGMDLRSGKRIYLEEVKREALAFGAMIRAALERVIDQSAPRLAIMKDDAERGQLLHVELARLRWMVKSELPRALRRMRAAGATTISKV